LDGNLNILMITHHRRFKSRPRSHAMAKYLVQRGHKVSLIVIADHRKVGIVESEWDGVRMIETPDLLWDSCVQVGIRHIVNTEISLKNSFIGHQKET
jgi:hypothetical protein